MNRDDIYQKFGPKLIETIIDFFTDEINTLRLQLGLEQRNKDEILNALRLEESKKTDHEWMNKKNKGA